MIDAGIRLIEPRDNPHVQRLVTDVLQEFGHTGPGFACHDPELKDMYATYQNPRSRYWVVVDKSTGSIVGGGGFSQLRGTKMEEGICELQKVYFYPQARGQGLGRQLVQLAIDAARQAGYREMYLETTPELKQALRLYEKLGFRHLDRHKGNTGHQEVCGNYMSLALAAPLPEPMVT